MKKAMGFGYKGTEKASMGMARVSMRAWPKMKSVMPKRR